MPAASSSSSSERPPNPLCSGNGTAEPDTRARNTARNVPFPEQSGVGGGLGGNRPGLRIRLIGMTLTDDRTSDGTRRAPDGRRRPSSHQTLRAVLLALRDRRSARWSSSWRSSSAAARRARRHSGAAPVARRRPGVQAAPPKARGDGDGTRRLSAQLQACERHRDAGPAPPLGAPSGGVRGKRTRVRALRSRAPVDSVTKVVKTGEIDLQVAKHQVPHTIDKLIALARLENGFVADSHSSEGASPSGSVTLRVPVQSFEATITEVRTHIAGKVARAADRGRGRHQQVRRPAGAAALAADHPGDVRAVALARRHHRRHPRRAVPDQ